MGGDGPREISFINSLHQSSGVPLFERPNGRTNFTACLFSSNTSLGLVPDAHNLRIALAAGSQAVDAAAPLPLAALAALPLSEFAEYAEFAEWFEFGLAGDALLLDVRGRERGERPDVGAFERSAVQGGADNRPLTPADVGPDYVPLDASDESPSRSPVAAIAGGIAAGVVAIVLLGYLIARRKRPAAHGTVHL